MTQVAKQAPAFSQNTDWQTEEERQRLLAEQLPQVRYIARRIHERLPRHVPLEDLVHAGVVGLIDALQKFDRGKRVQFGSYAKFRIRGAILDSLRGLDWAPRQNNLGNYGAGILAAGQALVRRISAVICNERATPPAAKRTSQNAQVIFAQCLTENRAGEGHREAARKEKRRRG